MTRLAGRYELVKRLAEGGMAEVWLGVAHGDFGFTRRVAIKRLFARDADGGGFERMFLDEARITSRLHHAGIVSILDFGVEVVITLGRMGHFHGHVLVARREQVRFGGLHWEHHGRSANEEAVFCVPSTVCASKKTARTARNSPASSGVPPFLAGSLREEPRPISGVGASQRERPKATRAANLGTA